MAFPATGAAAPNGARLYELHCAACHGPNGEGNGVDADIFSPRPANLRAGSLERRDRADLVRRVREGRSSPIQPDPERLRAQSGRVEELIAYLKRLPAIPWRLVEDGQGIYVQRCESCHGRYGAPRASLPPGVRSARDLSDAAVQRSISDRALVEAVRHGREGMPALTPQVREEETPQLVAFVRLLSPGFELYSRYCAACHGDDGRGGGSFGEAMRMPTTVFDRAYFERRDAEEIRSAVWHMVDEHEPRMPHYREVLSEAQAGAIIEYLRAPRR